MTLAVQRAAAALACLFAASPAAQAQITPTVTWSVPAEVPAGTVMTPELVDLQSDVPGTFELNPAAGTILTIGRYDDVTAMFHPDDPVTYATTGVLHLGSFFATIRSARSSLQPTSFVIGVGNGVTGSPPIPAADLTRGRLYIPDRQRRVIVEIDVVSESEVRTISLPDASEPLAVALDAGLGRLYVSDNSGSLWQLDLESHTVLSVTTVPEGPPGSLGSIRELHVNHQNHRIYAFEGNHGLLALDPGDTAFTIVNTGDSMTTGVLNADTGYFYVTHGPGGGEPLRVIDIDSSRLTYHTIVATVPWGGVYPQFVLDRSRNRIYAVSAYTSPARVAVIDADPSRTSFNTVVDTITLPVVQDFPGTTTPSVHLNPLTGVLYVAVGTNDCGGAVDPTILGVDPDTHEVLSALTLSGSGHCGRLMTVPGSNKVILTEVLFGAGIGVQVFQDIATAEAAIAPGAGSEPVHVSLPLVDMRFASLTSAGNVSAVQVPLSEIPLAVPGQYAVAGAALEITTTAAYAGIIRLCFNASFIQDPVAFAALSVLHGEGSQWVDRTVSREFSTGTICAEVSSLSPFALAHRTAIASQIQTLFDTTRAFKTGSTIPIKVQVWQAGLNVSSGALGVIALEVRRVSSALIELVQDAGNANPDTNFRFDPITGSYIFNLSTKGRAPGTYELRLRVGDDPQLHVIPFALR